MLGDRDRLRQVVDNLLANVRAHTPPATPVRVGARAAERQRRARGRRLGARAWRRSRRARVFERFYRADPSRARASGGVGLGLSIVAAVAEAHGGSVGVESVAASGTSFRIDLPLSPAS